MIPRTTPSLSVACSIPPRVPLYAIEYLVYHEMLHLRHPVKLRGSRRLVHPAAFREEEKLFPQFKEAQEFLKRLGTLD